MQVCSYESQVHAPKYEETFIEMDFCLRMHTWHAYIGFQTDG